MYNDGETGIKIKIQLLKKNLFQIRERISFPILEFLLSIKQ